MTRAERIMSFISTKKQLINAYAGWGCGSFFVKHHCRGIDWRK